MKSDDISSLVKALVKVQAEIKDAEKNAQNQHFKNQYANLESVIHATRAPLANHGLVVTQVGAIENERPVLITLLLHESGQWLQSTIPILNDRNNAQGMGSAISYARRYALSAICGITQTDDDGESAVAHHHKGTVIEALHKPVAAPLKAPPPSSPGEYVVRVGKRFMGMQLKDIEVHEVENFVRWIEEEAGDSFRANPATKEFQKYAAAYLAEMERDHLGALR